MSASETDKVSDAFNSLLVEDQHTSSYALFSYLSKRDFDGVEDSTTSEPSTFQMLSSTLDPDQIDQLTQFLVGRLKKGSVYLQTGNFFEMDFTSKKSPTSFDTCFYIFLPTGGDQQLILCLLAPTETNLETFRSELTAFCETLVPGISENKDLKLTPDALATLSSWYDICVNYACRVIEAVGSDISCLLQLAQENGKVSAASNVDSLLVDDVKRFVSACMVADCLKCDVVRESEAVISVADSPGKHSVTGVVSNQYCVDWGKLLIDHGQETEPWKLRRVLEAFKLKTIKDMNILKRLLKQSEMDHYSIYRTYSFLCNSGNGDILLCQAKMEQGSATAVIELLEKHLAGHSFRETRLQEQ